jgi:hypothetical protein
VYSLLGESSAILFIMNYPVMQWLFDFVPLELADWMLLFLLAVTGFIYSEIIKFWFRDLEETTSNNKVLQRDKSSYHRFLSASVVRA